jgi:hypothetical protein
MEDRDGHLKRLFNLILKEGVVFLALTSTVVQQDYYKLWQYLDCYKLIIHADDEDNEVPTHLTKGTEENNREKL